jgi:hypothetical protein
LGLALLQDASSATAAAAIIMYFFIVVTILFFCDFLVDGKSALATHLSVLVHHAMYASVLHGLAVVYVLRGEPPVLLHQHFYEQQQHACGDDDNTDQ